MDSKYQPILYRYISVSDRFGNISLSIDCDGYGEKITLFEKCHCVIREGQELYALKKCSKCKGKGLLPTDNYYVIKTVFFDNILELP